MAKYKRHKTKYPGVHYIEGTHPATGKVERTYYIRYRRDGKLIEEKAGHQYRDNMTPAKASKLRALRIDGDQGNNRERRETTNNSSRTTIGCLWEAFQDAKKDNKSIRDDFYRWGAHLEKSFGDMSPTDLTTSDIDQLKKALKRKRLAPATVRQVLVQLQRILNFGVSRGLCDRIDPVRLQFEMPKVNNMKTEDLTRKQLKALLRAIEEDSNIQAANIMRMVLCTGMRRGELFALKWDHVDFERGFIHIESPKGGLDQKIPLNPAARDILTNHPKGESPYIFPGRNGQRRKDIRHQVARIKKRAGLPKDFRPLHGLRHVYASTLASSGKVDMYTLSKLLTHKSPEMTQRYAHLRDEALAQASNIASDFMVSIRPDA